LINSPPFFIKQINLGLGIWAHFSKDPKFILLSKQAQLKNRMDDEELQSLKYWEYVQTVNKICGYERFKY